MPMELYETSDIYIAAFLMTVGADLVGVDRSDRKRVKFQLKTDPETREELVRGYWSGKAMTIVPSQLFSCLKHLKGQIYMDSPQL